MTDLVDQPRHTGGEVRGGGRPARGEEGAIVDAQALFDHLVAEGLEQGCGAFEGSLNFRIDGPAGRCLGRPGDAQLARAAGDFFRIGSVLGRRRIGRIGLGLARGVEHDGGIPHGPADDVIDHVAERIVEPVRQVGVAVAGDLQAHQAATGGRNADRTQPIGGVRHRHNAGRDSAGGAARRSARDMVWVPGIAAGAKRGALGGAGDSVFRRVGLAQGHDAGLPVANRQPAIFRVDHAAGEPASRAAGPAGDGHAEVLDQKGNALEGTFRQRALRPGAGVVVPLVDHGVQRWVVPFDPRNGGFDQLQRRHRFPCHQFGEADAVEVGIVGHFHGRYLVPPVVRKASFSIGARLAASRFNAPNAPSAAASIPSMSASVMAAHMNMLCQGCT